ncbi:lipoprotein [Flavisphingomonas formosensis]|uniref:lipoprotein n=1 Tax=Flavisphingomonas formosensis TaxID=861534 RepID=UPI0012F80190|nr:lipoprotein [Sphingomonas formosensis]
MKRALFALSLAAALAGCGKREALQPASGQSLPPKPAMAAGQPSVDQLLAIPTNARPDRSDEPLTKSAPRKDDHFDLPPPG